VAFTGEAKTRPGNGEQLPVRILASRAKSPASPHHGAKGHSNCSRCAVVNITVQRSRALRPCK
jgi:hypothetical protein